MKDLHRDGQVRENYYRSRAKIIGSGRSRANIIVSGRSKENIIGSGRGQGKKVPYRSGRVGKKQNRVVTGSGYKKCFPAGL